MTHQVELEPGQTILILGAGGGVGLMAAQIGSVHEPTKEVVRTREGVEKTTGVALYGLVDPHVTHRYSFDRDAEAVAFVEAGHTAGKVIIEP